MFVATVCLQDVSYSPANAFNLISIPQLLVKGWTLGGTHEYISVTSPDGVEIKFDIVIKTPKGQVYAVCMKRLNELTAVSADGTETKIRPNISINEAHAKLGHCSQTLTRITAEHLKVGIIKNKPFRTCTACGMGKAKQKNVPKSVESDEPAIGERLHGDISTIRKKHDNKSYVRPNWFMLIDAASGMKFSSFWNTKAAFIETTCETLHRWLKRGIPIKFIRVDNAGENKLWEARCQSAAWKFPFKFEYTAARTPQQNSKVEVGFAVIANRGRTLMAAANVPGETRRLIWNEAFQAATLLDGLVLVTVGGVTKTRWEHWYGNLPAWSEHLRTWGEAGVVKIRGLATPKVADRGVPCMFVGYSKDHPGDTYRMFNPATGGIHDSRDVIWLRRMFYQKPLSPTEFQVQTDGLFRGDPVEVPAIDFDDVDALEDYDAAPAAPVDVTIPPLVAQDAAAAVSDESSVETEVVPATRTRSGRVTRPVRDRYDEVDWSQQEATARQLLRRVREDMSDDESSTSEPEEMVEEDEEEVQAEEEINFAPVNDDQEEEEIMEMSLGQVDCSLFASTDEIGLVGASLGGGFASTFELKPLNYDEAMAGQDKVHWQTAMDEEQERFVKHKAVLAMPRSQVPKGAKIMDSAWACKKKSNGVFRARLNLRGFKQVDGEHFDSHSVSSPVANIITIHLVLALMAIVSWFAVLVDVRGAFLLGEWESDREIFMEVPKGWAKYYEPDSVLKLLKTVYGARQSAKRFWILLLKVMDEMHFARSKADPCLYFKWDTKYGLLLIISWIDDLAILGTRAGVEATKDELFKHFDCDDTGEMKEYVGNKVDRLGSAVKLTQPVLLQSFTDEFDLQRDHKVKNPAIPGSVLHPTEGKLSSDDMFTYRSGTGKLLHLMKWSRPEIGNSVRELSRYMSGAGMSHMKAMYRVMNYCLNTSQRGKVFKPRRTCKPEEMATFEFVVEGYSDSDYAKDPIKRRSVSGFCSFIEGCVLNTKSRMQPITSLSVTEAELVAATECAQDLLYVKHVMESIGLKVRTPMNLNIDNSGCIDLICNWSAGGRTRHMETRMYFLRELKEEEPPIIMPVYCPTAMNHSDIFTKNCDTATFDEHVRVFCTDDAYK